jgi:hypothetical protein
MNEKEYTFRVKFDGSEHVIDTETYIQALISLTTVLKEVNYQLGKTERISINVAAESEGSFDVAMVLKATEHLFNEHTISYLSGLVTITGGLITLKKYFRKSDPGQAEIAGDVVTIKDVSGNVIYQTTRETYNIYATNQVVQDALSSHFGSLDKDENISGFELNYNDESVRINKEEFADLAQRVEIELPERETVTLSTGLVIVKMVFEGRDRKWEFLYNGVKISATISDSEFWDRINAGQRFGKGDVLVGDLKIFREYDANVGAYYNREYQVSSVREHKPRAVREQTSLEDLNNN